MRTWIAAASLACACTVGQARRVHTVSEWTLGGSLAGMLGVLGTAYAWPGENPVLIDIGLGFVPVALASALAYVAVDGMVQNAEPPAAPEHSQSWQTAMDLARQAKHAARDGDCAEVRAIEPRVRELDLEIYGRFLHEPVIRACLGPGQ